VGELGWRWVPWAILLLGGAAAPAAASQARAPDAAAAAPAVDPGVLPPAAAPTPAAEPARLPPPEPAERVDGYRGELERAWFTAGDSLGSRASAARTRAIELGATNAANAARALVAPASRPRGLGEALLAVKIAPDLPLARSELARVHWQDGERAAALGETLAAIAAIPRNLEASLWLLSSLLVIACVVMVAGSLVFVALAGLSVFARAAHDVGDLVSARTPAFARAGLLGGLVIAPVMLGEGVAGLVLSCLALAVAYGSPRLRMASALACALLVVGLFPVARLGGHVLATLDADPVAAAANAVLQDVASRADVELLRSVEEDDELAALALAVRARRVGNDEAAFARYRDLQERAPGNPIVMTNLANLHFRRGEVERATALYEQATEIHESPVLWFNLSQAYARSFRMEEFEHALREAQSLGSAVVEELSAQEDPSLIADLPIPVSAVRDRMLAAAQGRDFAEWLRAPLLPGRLAGPWTRLAGALALVGVLALLVATRFDQAGTCGRCGKRICTRCDGTVWNTETCENCYQLFNHPESADAKLRIARLGELRARELRMDRLARLGALLLPGVSGMVARRPDLAFMGILFFGWAALAYAWRGGVVPDPLVVGSAGPLVLVATALAAALAYAAVVVSGLYLRRNAT